MLALPGIQFVLPAAVLIEQLLSKWRRFSPRPLCDGDQL
jgi:hypothetical protein